MCRSGGSFFYANNESNSRSVFYLVHANPESYNTFHIHIVKREHRGNGCENMKKGMWGVVILALVLITGLSVFYWVDVGEKVVTASTSVNGQEFPICSVETGKKQIAYTFELSGTNQKQEQVEQLLQILKQQEIPATFFATASWIENNRSLAIQICQQGHEIQGLSEQEVCVEQMTARACRKELQTLREMIGTVTEEPCVFFRIPGGEYNNEVLRTVYACGSYPVAWSIDSLDWKDYGAENQVKQMLQTHTLRDGEVLRFHAEGENTGEMVSLLHPQLKEEGYEAVTVSQMIVKENYFMETDGRQIPESQNKAIFS